MLNYQSPQSASNGKKVFLLLSVEIGWTVPDWKQSQLGDFTLVRGYPAKFNFSVTNEDTTPVAAVTLAPVIESYVGQESPQLFQRLAPRTIKTIAPKGTSKRSFDVYPVFPGVLAVAVSLTDNDGIAIKARRDEQDNFEATPVRWWFHVLDDVSIETLVAVRELLALVTKKEQ